jgi:hypothetical protein
VLHIDPTPGQSLAVLISQLRRAFGRDEISHPADLRVAAAQLGHREVVICNAHRLLGEALEWLLRALLDGVGSNGQAKFIIEGSVDIDSTLRLLFPNGTGANPFVIWSEPSTPWTMLGDAEEFVASRARFFPAPLVPWIVDHARNDFRLVSEFLERLPRAGAINEATVAAVWSDLEARGAVAAEIRVVLGPHAKQQLLHDLARGDVVTDLAPPMMTHPLLRALYVGGIVSFDPTVQAYGVRSPAVARIVAGVVGDPSLARAVERGAVHARTSFLIWRIAAVELQLRRLIDQVDWTPAARSISIEMPWYGRSKQIRGAVSQLGVSEEHLKAMSSILESSLPDKQTLLDVVQTRRGSPNATREDLADRMTFSEVANLAIGLQLVRSNLRPELEIIMRCRNDVAHFRGTSIDDAHKVLMALDAVQLAIGATYEAT